MAHLFLCFFFLFTKGSGLCCFDPSRLGAKFSLNLGPAWSLQLKEEAIMDEHGVHDVAVIVTAPLGTSWLLFR